MESLFCFEIAVDNLQLRKRVKCAVPYVAIAFLNFPTILLNVDKTNYEKTNLYNFKKGKSCLFKMSPTELFKRLTTTPVYIVVFDKMRRNDGKEVCIGSSSFCLEEEMKNIIRDVQAKGLDNSTCHGNSITVTVTSFLQDIVGCLDVAYKLTCLGHVMLPHLSAIPVTKMSDQKLIQMPKDESALRIQKPDQVVKLSSIENVVCPPVLFYEAKVKKNHSNNSTQHKNTASKSETETKQSVLNGELFKQRENIIKGWRDNSVVNISTAVACKSEATQTEVNHLDQFPILQGLIQEVLELGLNRPISAPSKVSRVDNVETISRPYTSHTRKSSQAVTTKQPKRVLPTKTGDCHPGMQDKKKRPLRYGLTKSHLLRLSKNKPSDSTKKPKKLVHSQKMKGSKKKVQIELASTFTQTVPHIHVDSLAYISEGLSESESVELPDVTDSFNIKTMEDLTAQDRSSPRAQSRQSIEIRLPTADTEDTHEDDPSGNYRYSDDFEEHEDHSWSYDRSTSALTTLDSSPQYTAYETSRENTERSSPHRLTVDVSPQHTISDISPSLSFGVTPRDSIPEEPEKEQMEIAESEKAEKSNDAVNIKENKASHLLDLSPRHDSHSHDDDSKPTDDSASIVTTLLTTKLPVPAPSSDSPVIRSLVSEPSSRKPHPPSVSHSSSLERIMRKFKRSTESSFHVSDVSDIRTSDLADIKTSDLSDLKSSDEAISPFTSTEFIERKVSLPKLRKKFNF